MNRLVAVCLLALALHSLLPAQSSTATVAGAVRDQSGAMLPNADVTLTNTATNVVRKARTNEAGSYVFPGVIPGPYRISAEAPGMAKYDVAFTVQVSQRLTIDPVMEVAQTTTTLEVKDVTPLVNLADGTIQSTMDGARIEQLPMNGRQLYSMLLVLPGAEGSDGRRMFGALDTAQEWIIDGVPVQGHRWNNVVASYNPGVGAVQEFSVDSNALGAKQSRPSNVVIATKSGTNALHATFYETMRNSAIGVARSRTDYWEKAPHFIRNEFGANGGGPVLLPGYDGRNKTFWFFNYEGYRSRNPTTRGYNVPTAAMHDGDFSELRDAQGRLLTLYDPWTTDPKTWARQPFAYGGKLNVIDPKRFSPVGKYLFDITPLPTTPANPLVDYNLWMQTPYDWDKAVYIARIDHRLSDRDSIFARVNRMGFDNLTDYTGYGVAWNIPFLNQVAGWKISSDREIHGSVTWNHTFSPTFFNELVVAAYHHRGQGNSGTKLNLEKDWFAELKLPNPFGANDWPQFYSGMGNYNVTGPGKDVEAQQYYVVDNNATKVVGRHQMMFGVHYRRDPLNMLPNNGGRSSFNFGTLATALYDPNTSRTNPQAAPQTGHNIANMLLGVSSYSASLQRDWLYLRSGNTALYFQDNFKVNPRLTLNLGLRWERWPAYREKRNIVVGFDSASKSSVLGTDLNTMYALGATLPAVVSAYQTLGWSYKTWDQVGRPQELVYGRNRNFAPRVSFAYRALDGSKAFVVRGGYSLAYFAIDINSWINDVNGNTPLAASFTYNPSDATQTPDGYPNYGLRSTPLYINGVNDRNVIDLSKPRGISRGSASATGFAPDLPDSRVHSWNLTIEKEVMASTVVRAGYVGNHTSNLLNFYDYNSPTPDYIWYVTTGQPLPTGEYANVARRPYDQNVLGTVREFRATGWGNSQIFNFEMERRYTKGYAYQVSYAISNVLYAGSRSTVNTPNLYLPGAVPTDYDQLNRFLNYRRDTGIPKHRVKWNWLLDLPFGKGKPIAGGAGRVLDKFIGGWQIAGIGTLRSNYFSLPTGNWNFTGAPIEIYGYKYPIENCTSGVCVPGYLWWNGYIPANKINSVDANGKPNGYMGVPSDYKPAVAPLIPAGSTALPANAPANTNVASFWDTNNVWVPLKNGSVQRLAYNSNLHPWRNQFQPSVLQWSQDASLFKNIPFSERVNLRFSADFFNVFNHPGNPNSVGGDGMLSTRDSGQAPRVLQLGLRLEF